MEASRIDFGGDEERSGTPTRAHVRGRTNNSTIYQVRPVFYGDVLQVQPCAKTLADGDLSSQVRDYAFQRLPLEQAAHDTSACRRQCRALTV